MRQQTVKPHLAAWIALFAATAFSQVAGAQTLWREARAGMTVPEISAAYPAAVPTPAGGFKLPPVEIASTLFNAGLELKDGKLAAVRLSADSKSPSDTDRLAKALLEALRTKYGQEVARERSSIGWHYTFSKEGVTINLEAIQIGSGTGLLQVLYTTAIAKDAAKL